MKCAGCSQVIVDRYLYKVQEEIWHGTCIRCFHCRSRLTDRCYSRDGKLFCKVDFYRTYGAKCWGCGQGISPEDLVRRTGNRVYHVDCLKCTACGRLLGTGQRFVTSGDDAVFCSCTLRIGQATGDGELKPTVTTTTKDDNITIDDSITSETSYDQKESGDTGECGDDTGSTESEKQQDTKRSTTSASLPEGKRRGPRTTIKAKQLEMLKTTFSQNPKPPRATREKLAKSTGLSMRVIQVWFQNRRSKERRLKQLDELKLAPPQLYPPCEPSPAIVPGLHCNRQQTTALNVPYGAIDRHHSPEAVQAHPNTPGTGPLFSPQPSPNPHFRPQRERPPSPSLQYRARLPTPSESTPTQTAFPFSDFHRTGRAQLFVPPPRQVAVPSPTLPLGGWPDYGHQRPPQWSPSSMPYNY